MRSLEVTHSSKHQAAEGAAHPDSSVAKTFLAVSRGTPVQVLIAGVFFSFNVTLAFLITPVSLPSFTRLTPLLLFKILNVKEAHNPNHQNLAS